MSEKLKNNLKPTITLGAICIIVAALLALVNMLAGPKIKEAEMAAVKESLDLVMPDGEFDPEPDKLPDGAPDTVTSIYTEKSGKGHVVTLVTTKGYTGNEIGITVAIGKDGKIISSVITKNDESIKNIITPFGDYGEKYAGASADNVKDVVTGATVKYTEAAVKNALYDAFVVLGYAEEVVEPEKNQPARPLDEVYDLALGMIPGATSLEKLELDGGKTLVAAYKAVGVDAYVFYTVTATEWVPVETECITVTDKNGVITAFDLLTWTVGYDSSIYSEPPSYTPEMLNDYIGRDQDSLGSVNLVTGATRSSSNLMAAVRDAVMSVIYQNIYDRAIALSGASSLKVVEQPEDAPATLLRTYHDEQSGSYVLYIRTKTEYIYKEIEALVYADESGKILGIDLINWIVGHGVECDKEFIDSLVGKRANEINHVDLVSGATGTSNNMRFAIRDALYTVSSPDTAYVAVAVTLCCVLLVGFVCALIYFKRRTSK